MKDAIRMPELTLKKKIYVTNKIYAVLRKQKKVQEKSMARIVCDLVLEKYGKKY